MLHSSREPCPSDFYENKNLPTHSYESEGFPQALASRVRLLSSSSAGDAAVARPGASSAATGFHPNRDRKEIPRHVPEAAAAPRTTSGMQLRPRHDTSWWPWRAILPLPRADAYQLQHVPLVAKHACALFSSKKLWEIDTVALSFVFDKLNIFQS